MTAPVPTAPNVCLSCGYDLTGLAHDVLCPECAFPIARSRGRSPLLRTADPTWLARIDRGLLNYNWSATALLCCLVGVIVLAVTFEAIAPTGDRIRPWLMKGLLLLTLTAAALLHAGACVRLSVGAHGGFSPGAAVRAALRITGLMLPLCVAYSASGLGRALASPVALGLIHGAFQATAFTFFFALATTLRELEPHTPAWNPALLRRHTNVRKNLIGLVIIIAVAYWVPAVWRGPAAGAGDWGMAFFAIAYVCMASAVSRVRTAVALELAIASNTLDPTIPTPSRSPYP